MATHLERLRKAIEARASKAKKVGGAGRVSLLGSGAVSAVREAIPTGLAVLDHHVIGCGGWPVGRISEVFSEEGLGKTSLALLGMAQAQQMGGGAIFVDNERSWDDGWAQIHGVDTSSVILLEPDTVEQAVTGIEATLRELDPRAGPYLVVWDSLAASSPQAELDGTMDTSEVGLRPRQLNKAFRKFGTLCARVRAHLLVVNQVRFKIGVMFGDPRTTPGGQAAKHHATLRLRLSPTKGGRVEERKVRIGQDVEIVAVKNKLYPPHRRATLRLLYAKGWDDSWATMEHAKETGAVGPAEKSTAAALEALGWSPSPTPIASSAAPTSPRSKTRSSSTERGPPSSGSRSTEAAASASSAKKAPAGKSSPRRRSSTKRAKIGQTESAGSEPLAAAAPGVVDTGHGDEGIDEGFGSGDG